MYLKLLYDVCERNSNVKHPATPFLQLWPTEAVGIATLLEFDENYRFLTASCGQYTVLYESHSQTF
jgi:hypothetical protein